MKVVALKVSDIDFQAQDAVAPRRARSVKIRCLAMTLTLAAAGQSPLRLHKLSGTGARVNGQHSSEQILFENLGGTGAMSTAVQIAATSKGVKRGPMQRCGHIEADVTIAPPMRTQVAGGFEGMPWPSVDRVPTVQIL